MRRALPVLLCLLAAQPALAHGLHAEATVRAGWVVLEMFFSDDARPEGAQVVAYRLEGAAQVEVARGATDARGVYRFQPDAPGRYRLRAVEAGGHRAIAEVTVEPLALTAAVDSQAAPTREAAAPDPGPRPPTVPWAGVAGGLLLIAILSLGLARWQRRGSA